MPDAIGLAEGELPATSSRVRISSPAGLLAVIPPLLGFEPTEPSLVVVGVGAPRAEVRMTLRFDIEPGDRFPASAAKDAISHLAGQRITTAAVVGYGPESLVTPVANEVLRRFPDAGIALTDMLRVQDQHYWSYLCTNPECCPPEGTPFDTKAHPVAAKFAGKPVLASRAALAQTIAPVTGDEAEAMRRAARRAEARANRLIREAGRRTGPKARRRALYGPGRAAVAEAITCYRKGGKPISHSAAAWLALVLKGLPVRDDAWARMLPEHGQAHLRLWTDVTRLAQPGYAAAPAALLAFVAWQQGDGALANVALDRAIADQPGYSMATLLRQALDSGAPPSMARLPMTPEEVAASYAAADAELDAENSARSGHGDDAEQGDDRDDGHSPDSTAAADADADADADDGIRDTEGNEGSASERAPESAG